MLETYDFGQLRVVIDHDLQCLTSVWEADDVILMAIPNQDQESTATAMNLGYENVWDMTAEHDLLHHVVARAQGQPYSEHLRRIAVGEVFDEAQQRAGHYEECMVFLVARALNRGRQILSADAIVTKY